MGRNFEVTGKAVIYTADAPLKYYLSLKACLRILNQAAKHKVNLPERLRWALAETPLINAGILNSNPQSNAIFPQPCELKAQTPAVHPCGGRKTDGLAR